MRMNLGGHKFLYYDGYGRFSLAFAKQLLYDGHDVHPFELESLDKPAWFLRAQGLDFSYVTLQLAPPHNFRHLPGRSIAWSMHESMTLPPGWADHVNQKTQLLLVPSEKLVEVFSEGGVKLPIKVVPGGIDPTECPVMKSNRSRPYTFMCLADRGNRKGHDLVYMAFYKAFAHKNRDVRLIMKCRPGSLPLLDFSYSSDPRLTIWRADVEAIADVFAVADACINPHRFEGYGMWPREAAACGLPVVVTEWSGTDDETDEWAIPLKNHTLVESYMEGSGGLWAQPDLDEIVHWMRWLYEHQDDAKVKGLKAAEWLRANRTYAQAAAKLTNAMGEFLGGPKIEPPKPVFDQNVIENNKRSLELLKIAARTLVISGNGHRVIAVGD